MYNKHFPVKTFVVKLDNRKTWLTRAIIDSIKLKNKLYIKYIKFPTNENENSYKKVPE